MSKHFLVYGTLRRGQRAEGMMRNARYLRDEMVNATMYNCGSFPGIILGGESKVRCELFVCDDEFVAPLTRSLDGYEGYSPEDSHNSLYLRKEIELTDGVSAFIYEWNRSTEGLEIVESGDWTRKN